MDFDGTKITEKSKCARFEHVHSYYTHLQINMKQSLLSDEDFRSAVPENLSLPSLLKKKISYTANERRRVNVDNR